MSAGARGQGGTLSPTALPLLLSPPRWAHHGLAGHTEAGWAPRGAAGVGGSWGSSRPARCRLGDTAATQGWGGSAVTGCHRLSLFPQGLEFPALACHRYFQVPSPACPARGDTRSHGARGHGHGERERAGLGGTGLSVTEASLCFQVGSAASWDLAVSAPQPRGLGTVGWGSPPPQGAPTEPPAPLNVSALSPQGSPPRPSEEPSGPWALEVSSAGSPPPLPGFQAPCRGTGGAEPVSPPPTQVELAAHKGNTAGGSGSNRLPHR